MSFARNDSATSLPFATSQQVSATQCPMTIEVIASGFPEPVTSDEPAAVRHTRHDIHERITLFVLVKTEHLEDQ